MTDGARRRHLRSERDHQRRAATIGSEEALVFTHVACFRWREGTGPDDVAEISAALAALPGAVAALRDFRFGPDAGVAEGNHDFAVVATFDDRDGYLAYAAHPAHQRVLTEVIRPRLASRVAVQFAT